MTRKRLVLGLFLAALFVCIAGAAFAWNQLNGSMALQSPVAEAVEAYRFEFVGYEVSAIAGKVADWTRRRGGRLTPEEQRELVERYNSRALQMQGLEQVINEVYADPQIPNPEAASAEMRAQLAALQAAQEYIRPLTEAVLERQVAGMLDALDLDSGGVVFPPVRFNFSALPRYLIVSPRERIETEAGIYLHADLDLAQIERIEAEVAQQFERSTLIEGLGGLGVWPTMVMDQASLSWVLSTIAHEWVHNYLVFRPLGWHMFDSAEMNTMNETVASIVGDEVGQTLAQTWYGIPAPPPHPPASEVILPEPDPDHFDFRTEMRRTRLRVDELLAAGQVSEAEQYMEARRRLFVENGYTIRKLNQAYFAFHGTYATAAASSDPIGSKLQELRALTPDLATFFGLVQLIRHPDDLDRLLAEWQAK